MTERPDPFDVAALERSINDSATRVSTIWVSYLIFALYLLIATGTATHRQLFLEEPLKLAALNIDLPLYWFFVLAPILFVIFHLYVLLQVLLLGRTAAAYNEIVDKTIGSAPENALMRQRLANTLFAQIFAGSPREREGWLGWLLRAMAWITLAFAPIYIILAFQLAGMVAGGRSPRSCRSPISGTAAFRWSGGAGAPRTRIRPFSRISRGQNSIMRNCDKYKRRKIKHASPLEILKS
jgi:hypothetical protein